MVKAGTQARQQQAGKEHRGRLARGCGDCWRAVQSVQAPHAHADKGQIAEHVQRIGYAPQHAGIDKRVAVRMHMGVAVGIELQVQ